MTDKAHYDARVQAAVDGDRAALAALATELLPRVRNLARYLVWSDDDVDDLAQDGLIAVLRGLRTFRGDAPLTAWVDRVVARAVFAGLKKIRRHDKRRDDGADLALVPAPGDRPDAYRARRELVRQLDALPVSQRHALVLHHVVGLTVPEIAAELAIPAETVRSRLRLGRARLRERAAADEAGDAKRAAR